ncbi:MAG: methyltransferase [Rhizobiales bacterium]|nr:methyltransferase [Hyphomicrobiales bacterium]
MTKTEFDEYANTFADVASQNTSFFDADYGYFGRYRSNIVKRISGANVANILDFGCGVGLGIRPLREAFPECRIVGCDPSQESLVLARASEPDCEFMESSAIEPKQQFDIVTAVSVFHHIVPSDRDAALRYCFERLKPGGRLFVFEHNPYNPLTRHLVSRCPVDRDAILLKPNETVARFKRAGFDRVAAEYCLFFPKALAFLRPIETSLGWLPLGGQYYVCGIRP